MFEITEKKYQKNIKKISKKYKKKFGGFRKGCYLCNIKQTNKLNLELMKTLTFTNKICEAIRNYIATKDLEMAEGKGHSAWVNNDTCIHYDVDLVCYRTFRINVWFVSNNGKFNDEGCVFEVVR